MATSQNPCGLTLNETLGAIKSAVLTGNYNGRVEVMKALQNAPNNYTYPEAKQITDYYYSIYNRVAKSQKNSKASIILSGKQKKQKVINNLAVGYLRDDLTGFPMNDEDVKILEDLYDKVDKADTPSLKAKYEEQAKSFTAKFLPNYRRELFRTSVYARPLLSASFFIKSLISNMWAQQERAITDSLWDGKKMDFTRLAGFAKLANTSFWNVLKGGVPATNLYHNEANQPTGSRLEEVGLKGTPAEGNLYYEAMNAYSRVSNRMNSAPDTRGVFSNAERHMYQLLKEKYRNAGKNDKEATQMAFKDMELSDLDTAAKMAIAKFKELKLDTGSPIITMDKKGLPIIKGGTLEFKIAVEEYRRIQRDGVKWEKALTLSKNDFWKRNMMMASELGFGDYGVFGLLAQGQSAIRNVIEKKSKNNATSAFNLWAFGFINGAANFAEDALERFPIYGAVKWISLGVKKSNVTDKELINDISRRQKDIAVKTALTAAYFFMARLAEEVICPSYAAKKVSSEEISAGYKQIGVCGIPMLVPPQMMAAHKVYMVLYNWISNKEELGEMLLNVLPIVVQSNNMGISGTFQDIAERVSKASVAKEKGQDITANEEKIKAVKVLIDAGLRYANSFVPLPSRMFSEAGVLVQRTRGIKEDQQFIPFDIDDKGNPSSYFNSMVNIGIHSLGNVTGVSELIIAAKGSNKNYAMDWQGRKVVQLRGSDLAGNGIQYNEYDDILREARVRTPYLNRLEKIEGDDKSVSGKTYYGKKSEEKETEVRYLTDDEYFNVSEALANFNKSHFEQYSEKLKDQVKENRSATADQLKKMFTATKKRAIEAVEKGKTTSEEIERYINKTWRTKGKVSSNKKVYDGE